MHGIARDRARAPGSASHPERPMQMTTMSAAAMATGWKDTARRSAALHPSRTYTSPVVVYERVLTNDAHLPVPTHRKRLNSERCKAFRAKKKKHEQELVVAVEQLRRHIADLEIQHAVATERMVHRRNSVSGSLVRVARQLKLFLQHNICSASMENEQRFLAKQADMVRAKVLPDAAGNTGDILKIRQFLVNAYSRISIQIEYATVEGPEEEPIVVLNSVMHCGIERKTLELLFPHILNDQDLVARLVGVSVPYHSQSQFIFNEQGAVVSYNADVDFVSGFLNVLGDLKEVGKVLAAGKPYYYRDDPLCGPCDMVECKEERDVEFVDDVSSKLDQDAMPDMHGGAMLQHGEEPAKGSMQFLLS